MLGVGGGAAATSAAEASPALPDASAGVDDPEGATGDIAVDASMTHWANPIAASSANLADSLAMAVCLIR